MNYKIREKLMKRRSASRILCDHIIYIKLKREFYKTAIRPTMLYDTECEAVKKQHIHKMSAT